MPKNTAKNSALLAARLPWPAPAVGTWGLQWGLWTLLGRAGVPPPWALLACVLLGLLCLRWASSRWRQGLLLLGFPLALLASGSATVPPWAWLAPLGLLLLLYPVRTWRDAPLFPTPASALDALPAHAPLPAGAPVLDAGCGLGHGLRALRRAYPQAELRGVEWSRPLRWLCALRCPWARVAQGDMWAQDWSPYALVYLFQRPESMARAHAKAHAELSAGAWLVSLDFALPPPCKPCAQFRAPDGKMVWVYRAPLAPPLGA
ncbi:MAG: class I SAM-dependent methyltransferase [Rhodoferax sp.]